MVPHVLVIVGPTSSGKSSLAIELARRLNGEVVSADSRQVYRGLTIGTGKVTKKEMRGVRHHLLDVASPRKIYSASDYVRDASKAIADIQLRGKLPIICGGTGFYIDALLGRIELPHVPPNPILRKKLESKSAPELYKMLQAAAPERAETIDRHNPVRLVRALEIAAATHANKPKKTSIHLGDTCSRCHLELDATWVGISPPSEILQKKIRDRLRARMKAGMVDEVRRLHAAGLSWKRMEALGLEYRYVSRHLRGLVSKETMLRELELAINQYAKRQITYWKRNKVIMWYASTTDALQDFKKM